MKNKFFKLLLNTIPILVILGCSNKGDYSSAFLSSSSDNSSLLLDGSFESPSFSSSSFSASTTSQKGTNLSNNDSSVIISSQTISESSHSSNQEETIPFDGEYAYDEYYCATDQSIIRIFNYGYLQYESENKSFIVSYSNYNNYYVIDKYSFDSSLEDNSTYMRDLLFFDVDSNEITLNTSLSIYSGYYPLSDKKYSFKKSYHNEKALYFYVKETANNLLVNISFNGSFENSEQLLSNLGLSEYANVVSSFSNTNNKGQVNLSFALDGINVAGVLSKCLNASHNETITNITYNFDNYQLSRIPNIHNYGLNDQNTVSGVTSSIINEQLYFASGNESGLFFNTYEELLNYLNTLKQMQNGQKKYQETINYLESLDESIFLNSCLVFSKPLIKENSLVSYMLNNLYLKDNKLFIVLNKITSSLNSLAVESYSSFALLINKGIDFQNIETLS